MSGSRYHTLEPMGLCLYCGMWCEQCNQCKCDIGRKRICPGFDVKKDPIAFEHWKLDLEIERLEDSLSWVPPYKRNARIGILKRLEELAATKEGLAGPG